MAEKSAENFPIHPFRQGNGVAIPQSFIPLWLAQIVYARWTFQHGRTMTLEQIAEQGGFGPMVMLDLLAGGTGQEPYEAFRNVVSRKSVSVKNKVQIVVPGTNEYRDAMKEMAEENNKAPTQVFYQNGGGLKDKR